MKVSNTTAGGCDGGGGCCCVPAEGLCACQLVYCILTGGMSAVGVIIYGLGMGTRVRVWVKA